jgi:hopanoid biosynthesis associated protein HpnK
MRALILNADDFGLTRGVNEGIIRAHRDGILTSTTLMANGPAFEHATELARANPTLGIGCHLVLVGGASVCPPSKIPSLVNKSGMLPKSLPSLVMGLSSGKIRSKEIELELTAQIEKTVAAGITPTHLDTHKHTHAHPRVLSALARVAKEFGITRIRKPVEDLGDSWESTRDGRLSFLKQMLGAGAARTILPRFRATCRKYGLRFPDHFLGLASTGHLGAAALRRLIDTLKEGQTEIMLHPGMCDDELEATGSRLQMHRQKEMEALLDPEVKELAARKGVRLITYRELE